MKTEDEIMDIMDKAEAEIITVLDKFGLSLGMLYPDGVSIMLSHQQQYPSGDYSFIEREAFEDHNI